MGTRIVAAMLLVMAGVAGFAAPPRDAAYTLALDGGAPDGAATTMRLMSTGGIATGGTVEEAFADVAKVTLDAAGIRGDVQSGADIWTLDATIEKDAVTGRYRATIGGKAVAGSLTGTWRAADWPCWRGPNGDGSAVDPGVKLVRDLSKARLVWKSEDALPSNAEKIDSWRAGYSSPVVADGRVFLFYYRPHGRDGFEFTAEDLAAKTTRNPTNVWQADDIIHCFDAATGKTLWKRVDERGLIGAHGKQGGHYTPCVAEGRVYVVGTTGRLYCLDAATGKLVWEGYLKDAYKDAFERSKAAGKSVFNRQGFNQVPCAVDGVVAVVAGAAMGFDDATGEKLWTVAIRGGGGGRGECTTPVRWTHRGKTYFVAGNTCIEPRTGKVLWQIPNAVTTSAPCVTEDYYICSGLAVPGLPRGQMGPGSTCFRITPQGFEKVWSMAPGRYPTMGCTDVVCGPYFVQEGTEARNIFVVEIATGEQVATIPEGFRMVGYSPLSCQGMVFGGMYALTHFLIGPTEFRNVKTPRGRDDWANSCSPAMVNGRLYYRTNENLVCYDLRDTGTAPVGAGK